MNVADNQQKSIFALESIFPDIVNMKKILNHSLLNRWFIDRLSCVGYPHNVHIFSFSFFVFYLWWLDRMTESYS